MTDYLLHGRYQLTERIASGGMGEVWRGTDLALGRPIAVKLLVASHVEDPQFRARFRAEARYAASLSHQGIAKVYDYGEADGSAYLVMELVNGDPLSAILERTGRLTPVDTLDIVAQAAQALRVAHQAGIVHRDIKPGNLIVGPDGTTKITDFGIATAVYASREAHLTKTGIVMGTAMYVSPEQATGASVTASSDIYSLGVVAYECLAGHPPFDAEQPLAIAIAHKHDPVPPLPDDVPVPVAELVLAMLAKTPEGRPETALHVADRAMVLRKALTGPVTLPRQRVTDEVTMAAELDQQPTAIAPDYTERQAALPSGGRRRLAAAAMTAALCAVGAIVALLLTSSGQRMNPAGKVQDGNARPAGPPAVASLRGTHAAPSATSTLAQEQQGFSTTTAATPSATATKRPKHHPTPSPRSPTPTPSVTSTPPSPTPSGSTTSTPPSGKSQSLPKAGQ